MKKVLLIFLFTYGFTTLLSAQKKFEIAITSLSVAGKGSIDSVHVGDKVKLTISLRNEGAFPITSGQYQPDTFPGGTYYFNYNVSRGAANEKKIAFSDAITLNGMGYKNTETVEDSIVITETFFIRDSNNIIIIWPSGGKAIAGNDSLDTVPHAIYTFYLYPHTAGIDAQIQSPNFKIYPNPAKDVVNIQMNESGTGIIRLMDMTGKLIATMPYSAKAGENISLPLNQGAAIPDGLYLISIETANSSQVSKIMICR